MTAIHATDQTPQSDELRAKQITAVSPEGRPAHPEVGRKQIVATALVVGLVVLAIALILGLTVSPVVGFGVGIAGMVLGIGTNTALWVSFIRAKERERVER
ncbi:MAG: hypothetical protein Tsb0013_09500 [Phycisphaerales bacterium]